MASIFDYGMDYEPGMFNIGAQSAGNSIFSANQSNEPVMPNLSSGQRDVSGFANYGMTPPPLPPMQSMPSIPDFSQPDQALAPQQPQGFQGIPPMPRPGLADAPGNSQPNQNPNPMEQIAGLMAMMGDPHKYARENTAMPQGGLMGYLQQLGVV